MSSEVTLCVYNLELQTTVGISFVHFFPLFIEGIYVTFGIVQLMANLKSSEQIDLEF